MKRIARFFKTTAIGGLLVVMPSVILFLVFRWLFQVLTDLLEPIADLIKIQVLDIDIVAQILSIGAILVVCFILGLLIKTKIGTFTIDMLESQIFFKLPGYRLVKETVNQLAGDKNASFKKVALVNIFGGPALSTAFVTDTHTDGSYTVFVPSGLNATSGLVIHLPGEMVHIVDVSPQEAMRSVVSCGTGSGELISALKRKPTPQ